MLQTTRSVLRSHLAAQSSACQLIQVKRSANTKPWKKGDMEKWKQGINDYTYQNLRTKKVIKVELPDLDVSSKTEELDASYMATLAKEKGVVPHRSWNEKPIAMTCSYEIANPYKPKPEDGRLSLIGDVKDSAVATFKKIKERPMGKIKSYLPEFNEDIFTSATAPGIYRKAHELLCQITCPTDLSHPVDDYSLLQYVTEKALPEILFRTDLRVIRWKLIQHIEPPALVNTTVSEVMSPGNKFAQLTVRFHSQQTLAIYDRFGRLIGGSENVVKDVLEYVVFENFLTSQYGIWRIHGKIIPEWAQSSLFQLRTSRKPHFKE